MIKLELATASSQQAVMNLCMSTDEVQTSAALLETALANQGLYLVKKNDELVGYITGRTVLDEAELDQIVIHSSFQHQGIAQQALKLWHGQLKTRAVERVFLEVREGNEPALRLYQALGYQEVGRRKGYYQRGEQNFDAHLMSCSLHDF